MLFCFDCLNMVPICIAFFGDLYLISLPPKWNFNECNPVLEIQEEFLK